MAENSFGVRLDDVPEKYMPLVEVMGFDAFMATCSAYGGGQLYIPSLAILRNAARDRAIREQFDGGNYKELASRFFLCERYIRRICSPKDGDNA